MDPHTLTISLTRSTKPPEKLSAWQSAPLRIVASLFPATLDVEGAASVVCQLRSQRTDPASLAPLAEVPVAIDDDNTSGPWTFDFTFSQMDIDIATGKKCRELWMNVTAVYASGRLEPLTARAVELILNPHSTAAATAAISAFTYDGAGFVTFTAGGNTYQFIVTGAGTPGTEGTITVDAGIATLTLGGVALQFVVTAAGSGSPPNTVTIATTGLADFTAADTSYQFTCPAA